MEAILFGIFVAVVLVVAIWRRRKDDRRWREEERYDEGGSWVDKRAGERGTFGSLDAEMESERAQESVRGKVFELARLCRDYAFEQVPGFSKKSDESLRRFSQGARMEIGFLISMAAGADRITEPAEASQVSDHAQALKKIMLDYCFEQFPALLDEEIGALRHFDLHAGLCAAKLARLALSQD